MLEIFCGTRTVGALQTELYSCRQKFNESVKEFGRRVEDTMMELIDASIKKHSTMIEQMAVEKHIREVALSSFAQGLKREYQTIIKARAYPTLNEAITAAIDEEKIQQGTRREPGNNTIICNRCNKKGHLARDCRSSGNRNENHGNGNNSLPTPSRSINSLFCNYCKKPGHVYDDCWNRKNRNGNQGNNSNNGNQENRGNQGNRSRNRGYQDNRQQNNGQNNSQENNQDNNQNSNQSNNGNTEEKKTIGSLNLSLLARTAERKNAHVSCVEAKRATGSNAHVVKPKTKFVINSIGSWGMASDFYITSPHAIDSALLLKVDTGAQCCIIKRNALRKNTEIINETVELTGVGGKPFNALCKVILEIETPAVKILHEFFVVDNDVPIKTDGILGLDFIKKHKVDILGGRIIKMYGHVEPLVNGSEKLQSRSESIHYVKAKNLAVGCLSARKIKKGVKIEQGIVPEKRMTSPIMFLNTLDQEVSRERPTVEIEEIESDHKQKQIEKIEVKNSPGKEEYTYRIEYNEGKRNTNADALSRIYAITLDQNETTDQLEKRGKERTRKVMNDAFSSSSTTTASSENRSIPNYNGRLDNQPSAAEDKNEMPIEDSHEGDNESETEHLDSDTTNLSEKDRKTILREYHDTAHGGHPGVKRMTQRIQEKYRWSGMKKEIKEYVEKCDKCQKIKVIKSKRSPMAITDTPERAFNKCAVDVAGPYPETDLRNKYFLAAQCIKKKN
ncbi:NAD-dependent protein deacetylase Sir2B-like [Venturia canescens]|uniref:NAD-dependent protein deacetylase Sir2B-like n=1 Tax=Venturia canescens TaxID=32260 RepID=UPI001C9D48DC|nr:NAD-dependent protein deacetylase Sir2B-like [Venturia canescens]